MKRQKSSPERVSVARYLRAVEAKKACWLLAIQHADCVIDGCVCNGKTLQKRS